MQQKIDKLLSQVIKELVAHYQEGFLFMWVASIGYTLIVFLEQWILSLPLIFANIFIYNKYLTLPLREFVRSSQKTWSFKKLILSVSWVWALIFLMFVHEYWGR